MWGVVKKAINSNLSKTLDNLLVEINNGIQSKLDRILSKGTQIETIAGTLNNRNGDNPVFQISGRRGVLKTLSDVETDNWFTLFIDGKKVDVSEYKLQRQKSEYDLFNNVYILNLEFNSSIKIECSFHHTVHYLIQTKN